MKPLNYYTTVSQETEADIDSASISGKIFLIKAIIHSLDEEFQKENFEIKGQSILEIATLNTNQSFGLIKALADQCQYSLISK